MNTDGRGYTGVRTDVVRFSGSSLDSADPGADAWQDAQTAGRWGAKIEDLVHEELFARDEEVVAAVPVRDTHFYAVVGAFRTRLPPLIHPREALRSPRGGDVFLGEGRVWEGDSDSDEDGEAITDAEDDGNDDDDHDDDDKAPVDDLYHACLPLIPEARAWARAHSGPSYVFPEAGDRILPRPELFAEGAWPCPTECSLAAVEDLPKVPDEAFMAMLVTWPGPVLVEELAWEEYEEFWQLAEEEEEDMWTVEEMLSDWVSGSDDSDERDETVASAVGVSPDVAELDGSDEERFELDVGSPSDGGDADRITDSTAAEGPRTRRYSVDSGCGTSLAGSCFGEDDPRSRSTSTVVS
ncbi:hypothetical protein BV20DRAFT_1053948 [Pilatotrama ljubarskyi]|nr:hypothetical protein BV20DRAFT_1053948 [Pilatotrama ljubarskyi]